MTFRNFKMSEMTDDDLFEDLCLDLWKRKVNASNMQRNGRRGQRQDGIDIFGRSDTDFKWVGIQCKVKSTGDRLTEAEVDEEITKALDFNPALCQYYIITTARRDQKLQEHIRVLDDKHVKQKKFRVMVLFWEEVKNELSEECNIDIYYKYYRDYFAKVEYFGNCIGKIIAIEIGIGQVDTRYELILGKTPYRVKREKYFGISYWKELYFIMNLHNKKFDNFPLRCYPSDIEIPFPDKRDAYIISKWLNSIKNIDDLIYGDSVDFNFSISREKLTEEE